jgi:hypothetical protein
LYTHTPPVFSGVPSTFMSAESLNLTLESFFGPILVGGASPSYPRVPSSELRAWISVAFFAVA